MTTKKTATAETAQAETATAETTSVATVAAPAETAQAETLSGLISSGTELNKRIKRFGIAYLSAGNEAHTLLVSSMYQAAKHSNVIPLNRFFNVLRTNDAQACKLYIRHYAAIIGMGSDDLDGSTVAEIQHGVDVGSIVKHNNNDGWFIVQNFHSDAAKSWVTMVEGRLRHPDGDRDKPLFTANNFAEVRRLGDSQLLTNLIRAAKAATGKSNDRTVIEVSDATKKFMQEIVDKAEARKAALSLSEA